MQEIGGRRAACKLTIDGNVRRVEHIAYVRHRSHGKRQLVDGINHRVRVAINNAGHHVLTRRVNHARVRRCFQIFADGCDLAFAQQNVRVLQCAVRDGQNSRIANQSLLRLMSLRSCLRRNGARNARYREQENECD